MGNTSPDLKALARCWRKRVLDTRLRLELARNRLNEIEMALRAGAITLSDGNLKRSHALWAERLALHQYRLVLRIFADLVLFEKIPDEAEWRNDSSENDKRDEEL